MEYIQSVLRTGRQVWVGCVIGLLEETPGSRSGKTCNLYRASMVESCGLLFVFFLWGAGRTVVGMD